MINSWLGGNEFNLIVISLKAWLSSTLEIESGAEGKGGHGFNEIRMNRKEVQFMLEPLPPGYLHIEMGWQSWAISKFCPLWTLAVQMIQVFWTVLIPSFEGFKK